MITSATSGSPSPVSIVRVLDCLGLFCPMPIVKTREALKDLTIGQVLGMVSDDPASDADMRSWARRTGQELLETSKTGFVYRFLVRKVR